MTVRIAELKDLEIIAEYEKDIFTTPWSYKSLEEAYESGRFKYYLIEVANAIVAYGGMYFVGDGAYVTNIATLESERGKGYGKSITAALVSAAKLYGVDSLSLEVRTSNSVAIRMYVSLGFKRLGIRKGFYDKPKEDAIIMTHYY